MPYFTAAASIGQKREEIDIFIQRLSEAFEHFLSADPFQILKNNAALKAEAEA